MFTTLNVPLTTQSHTVTALTLSLLAEMSDWLAVKAAPMSQRRRTIYQYELPSARYEAEPQKGSKPRIITS